MATEEEEQQGERQPQVQEQERKPVPIVTHHDADEVARKLFAPPDLNAVQEEAKSLWGWVSSTSSNLKERAQKLAADAAPLADSIASNVKQVTELADAKRREAVDQVRAAAAAATGDGDAAPRKGVLPWEEPGARQFSGAIRDRVLALSRDDKTFLVPPPEAVGFEFEFETRAQDALAVMEADPQLQEKRFKLVPDSISEEDFWRNFFYRVALIVDAYGVGTHDDDDGGGGGNGDEDQNENHDDGAEKSADQELDLDLNLNLNDDNDDGGDGEGGSSENHRRKAGDDDENNFDMLDDDELLAAAGIDDDDNDDDDDLEARINEELG